MADFMSKVKIFNLFLIGSAFILFFSQEERRVVYVGKIRGSMTQRELRERFTLFGEIEECTLHFREHG